MDAEPVLFIDDDQPQLAERDAFLHQRMRANGDGCAARDGRQRRRAVLALHLAGQPDHLDAQRFQPRPEVAQVLLGQRTIAGETVLAQLGVDPGLGGISQ